MSVIQEASVASCNGSYSLSVFVVQTLSLKVIFGFCNPLYHHLSALQRASNSTLHVDTVCYAVIVVIIIIDR